MEFKCTDSPSVIGPESWVSRKSTNSPVTECIELGIKGQKPTGYWMNNNNKCSDKKRSRKSLTLNAKLEIIKLSERVKSMAEIGRQLGLARQTVSTIVNAKEKVLKEIKSATSVNTKVIRKRDGLIAEMEKLLLVWIDDQNHQNMPLSRTIIQDKALSLFNAMKAEKGEEAAEDKFKASRGWFSRFKERSNLHVKVEGEPASDYTEAAESYPCELAKMIEDDGYTKQDLAANVLSLQTFVSHDKAITDTEPLIDEQRHMLHEEESQSYDSPVIPREMTTSELEKAVKLIERGMAAFERIDPDLERSSNVNTSLQKDIICYKEILRKRRQPTMRQSSLLSYFKRVTSQPSVATVSHKKPSTSTQVFTIASSRSSSKRIRLVEES